MDLLFKKNTLAAEKVHSKDRVSVYTPESALRNPMKLIREMFRDLYSSRELAWRLFVRDVSARYRQSLLGYVWAFLPPIVATCTFVLLNRSGILNVGNLPLPYPAYVMIGTLLWQVFADAINSPIKTVTAAKSMLVKINFPREAILISGMLDVFLNFAIRLILLIAIFIYYGIVPPITAPLAVTGVFAIFCLGIMIGIILTPIGILYTDIGQVLSMVLSFWMLFTPVVYAPPTTGILARLTSLNPVSPLIVTTREWLAIGAASNLFPASVVFLITMVLLFAGWLLYRLAMPILIERMGG
ncbi:MAG: ABC transporter permease [Syntrophaceae bacterium]|nr:ABC transporter permease [Syntrophaceae bacterium]